MTILDTQRNIDQIIINVLKYELNKDEVARQKAIENINVIAKFYRLSLSKKTKLPLLPSLLAFVENRNGYMITLPNLYNAII